MIKFCPHCGYRTKKKITNGIKHCENCLNIYDSSQINCFFSAFWEVRKNNLISLDTIQKKFNLSTDQLNFLERFAIIDICNYQEFKENWNILNGKKN